MKRLLVGLALCAGTIVQPAFPGQKQPPASTEDDRIIDQVRMRLAGDADVKGGALEVSVKDGEVVIKGRVDTEKGKSKATKLAKKVKGVKSVDNELAVGPPA
jgi:hyperosmotically inducible protein